MKAFSLALESMGKPALPSALARRGSALRCNPRISLVGRDSRCAISTTYKGNRGRTLVGAATAKRANSIVSFAPDQTEEYS
jgi:hypothetical protein